MPLPGVTYTEPGPQPDELPMSMMEKPAVRVAYPGAKSMPGIRHKQ
jgi:hypothetical protein